MSRGAQGHQHLLTQQPETTQSYGSRAQGPYTCGGTKGWRCVVYLDMTDPSTTCPSGWQLIGHSKRTCGRTSRSTGCSSCNSVMFPVSEGEYSKVCGRIKVYQWGVHCPTPPMHGDPQEHIWTFAAGISEEQYSGGYINSAQSPETGSQHSACTSLI